MKDALPCKPSRADVIHFLEGYAPRRLAADWDNVGLLVGSLTQDAQRVMTCLTVTLACVAEAVARNASLIVSHHPMLFKPVKRVTSETSEGRMLLDLISADIAVYSPHTAFDNCAGGINDVLAAKIGLEKVRPLVPGGSGRVFKLVVFVPDKDLAPVADALFAAGAGEIGQYRECSYRLPGTGTFFGGEHSKPQLGQKGRREEVAEWRLEVVCPEVRLTQVVAAMRRAHSYEEPAYDLYPLHPTSAAQEGEGRLGFLPQPTALRDLARQVREMLACGPVQLIGSVDRHVRLIAIVCGAGGSFVANAARAGADVLLTGEARFHDYLTAEQAGLALVLPGHYGTERIGVEMLAARIAQAFPGMDAWASETEKDPCTWV